MSSWWAEHAWLPGGVQTRIRFGAVDGVFTAVETGVAPRPGDERLTGVVLPGLADTHSHAFHRGLRGRTQLDRGSFWTWRKQMYALAARLQPDSYLALARAVYAEMVLAGYTAVGEFHYLHHDRLGRPYADPNAMGEALVQAAADAGIRLTLLDTLYLSGGLGPSGHEPLAERQRRFSDGDVTAWATRISAWSPHRDVIVGAAAHSVRAVPATALAELRDAAGERPLHLHLSEQSAENAAALAHYGRTPTELMADAGLLGPRTTAVHATHLTSADIELLGSTGTGSCLCPTTEADLADGLGCARALADRGSPLSLGSDSHAVIDPFAEIRGLEAHERLHSGERGRFTPGQLLSAASTAGYTALGRRGGGQIVPGAPADFVVVRSDSARTAGSAPEQIIWSATAADVDRVVVAGATVVAAGRHRLGDPGRLLLDALAGVER